MEDKIKKAYGELHRRKVLHGDVRASNILISNNESIYIIDFESARTGSETLLESEMSDVERLLEKVKIEWIIEFTYSIPSRLLYLPNIKRYEYHVKIPCILVRVALLQFQPYWIASLEILKFPRLSYHRGLLGTTARIDATTKQAPLQELGNRRLRRRLPRGSAWTTVVVVKAPLVFVFLGVAIVEDVSVPLVERGDVELLVDLADDTALAMFVKPNLDWTNVDKILRAKYPILHRNL